MKPVDLTEAAVTARLREASRLRDARWPTRPLPDLSEAAVTARLLEVAALNRLCAGLASALAVYDGQGPHPGPSPEPI